MANRPSLIKQLLGAVVGSAIALTFYTGYKYAQPSLSTALILPRTWFSQISSIPGALRFTGNELTTDRNKQHLMQQALEAQTQVAAQYAAADRATALADVTPPAPKRPIPGDIPPGFPDEMGDPTSSSSVPMKTTAAPKKLASIQKKTAPGQNLPDSGFGLGAIAAMALGSAGGYASMRRRREA